MANPGELLFDAAGRFYLSDPTSIAVFATSSSAAPTKLLSQTAAYEMALDASNRLAVGSFMFPALSYYTTNGTAVGNGPNIKAGSSVVAGQGDDFWGRELYAVSTDSKLIRIDSFGNTTVVGTNFDGVISMAFGPDNALYLCYRDYDLILRIAPEASPTPNHGWPADGNASNAVNTAHGTLVGGVTYQPGKYGQAFRFDAIGSEITFSTNAGNFGSGDFTVMYWVNTTNQTNMYVMSKWFGCGFNNFWETQLFAGNSAINSQKIPILAKVAALPITRWNFKTMKDRPHLGPMAQDFHAAFGLGGSDTTITTVDADGVALAAIQGLNQKLEQKETEITELKRTVNELKELMQALNSNLNGGAK